MSSSSLQKPLVSIGIPVYNGELYIQEAVDSVISQDYQNIEIIISDNASTDGTSQICRAIAAKDPRVRYYRHETNRGAAWNFNFAFYNARGEYFKWAAHDDVMKPSFISKCVNILKADHRCILVYPEAIFIDANGVEITRDAGFMASESDDPVSRFRTWMAPGIKRCNPVYGLIRSSAVRKTSLHGAYPGSDHVLLGEIAMLGRTKEISEPLFLRRLHPQMTSLVDTKSLTEWFEGRKSRGLHFKALRLIKEFGRAIWKANLSPQQRLRCYSVLFGWAWRLKAMIAKELLIPLYMNGRPTAITQWLRARGSSMGGKESARSGARKPASRSSM